MVLKFSRTGHAAGSGQAAVLALGLLLLLQGCAKATEEERGPERAGKPISASEVVVGAAALQGAALAGDEEATRETLEAFGERMRKAIKLADPARAVDRESARVAARQVSGVRSVAWLDRENLFVIVDSAAARTYETVDRICMALEPLGDTLGVVVSLQNGAAKNGDELEILSRNCQLAPGERALLSRERKIDVVDPAFRAQHQANQVLSEQTEEDRRRQEESLRILEGSTPAIED